VKRILVTGAAGMIGRKLTERLAKEDAGELILHDVVPLGAGSVTSDLSAQGEAEKLLASRPDVIFHLAAMVSGEAEADFEKGYRINHDGTRRLFEAIRKLDGGYKPRVVFASSIAVFGAPFPEAIGDEFVNAPLTSYGTQKTICELLLSDYSRKGFFDGSACACRRSASGRRPTPPRRGSSPASSASRSRRAACCRAAGDGAPLVRPAGAAIGFLVHAQARHGTAWRAPHPCMPGILAMVGEQTRRSCGASPARKR
jgi:NAD(P)-dependent dehydrogenase (short-subunit alcohol dehydrogenase family)